MMLNKVLINCGLMLHVDFAESYKNDQQEAIQSAYFGNRCFRIFTACYAKKKVLIITMLEMIMLSLPRNSSHDRVASMGCLQKVVHKIKLA